MAAPAKLQQVINQRRHPIYFLRDDLQRLSLVRVFGHLHQKVFGAQRHAGCHRGLPLVLSDRDPVLLRRAAELCQDQCGGCRPPLRR